MKQLKDMTFEELAQYCQGKILLGIPVGKFNEEVYYALDLALRWRSERDTSK